MKEVIKHINDTNASYRSIYAGNAKNTDLFLDREHYTLFEGCGEQITFRLHKKNLAQAILFIASILPRKFDQGVSHKIVDYTNDFIIDQLAILDAMFVKDGLPVDTITQVWTARIDVPKSNGEIDNRFYFNGLLSNLQYTNIHGEKCNTKFIIRNYLAGGYSEIHIKKGDDGIFDLRVENVTTPFNDHKEDKYEDIQEPIQNQNISLQLIFYGPPGTGKSHTINKFINENHESVIRTTFHPDSDYSTFVGAYKPTTKDVVLRDLSGHKIEEDGKTLTESKIVYEFVNQAFLNAYIQAWKFYADAQEQTSIKNQFLVIEEINRGNCAQIFGDLFQLLDRNDEGFSEYPIQADADMKKHLKKAFENVNIALSDSINNLYPNQNNIVNQVLQGNILLLPNNLFIWATMNTSDQSLFPIDSAFKRRWDWEYMPIYNANKGYKIKIKEKEYDWWNFLQGINTLIGTTTNSEDKKLGYFFCKADKDKIITAEKFVSKVIFYLWNNVFKDYEFADDIFNDVDGEKLTFDKFYTTDEQGTTSIVNEKVELFIKKVEEKYHIIESKKVE